MNDRDMFLAAYAAIKPRLRTELDPWVRKLRERIDVAGEPEAMLELFAEVRDRPREEVGGFLLHTMLLLANRETID